HWPSRPIRQSHACSAPWRAARTEPFLAPESPQPSSELAEGREGSQKCRAPGEREDRRRGREYPGKCARDLRRDHLARHRTERFPASSKRSLPRLAGFACHCREACLSVFAFCDSGARSVSEPRGLGTARRSRRSEPHTTRLG